MRDLTRSARPTRGAVRGRLVRRRADVLHRRRRGGSAREVNRGPRRRARSRPSFGKGRMWSALVGSLQISCVLTEDFLRTPVDLLLYSKKSARVYLFPQSVKNHYSGSGPISVDLICPQPSRACAGVRTAHACLPHACGMCAFCLPVCLDARTWIYEYDADML